MTSSLKSSGSPARGKSGSTAGVTEAVAPTAGKVARRPYLTPVPDCEPPFDDERSAVSRLQRLRAATSARLAIAAQEHSGSTALGQPGISAPGEGGPARAPETVSDAGVPGWSQDADMGVRRTTTAQLPHAGRSGSMLARALVEVLCGQRPLPQLRVHCAPHVFAGLQTRSTDKGPLGHLLTVRVSEPADGVAEVAAVFRRGERVRALAFRIQGVDGRWRVTALQTG